jgi:hypothetical protein
MILFRRDGSPYPEGEAGTLEWCRDHADDAVRVVRQDPLGDYLVSTVWIGVDMDHFALVGDRPHLPLIFETMVFDADSEPLACQRWRTENDAIAGHIATVDEWRQKLATN